MKTFTKTFTKGLLTTALLFNLSGCKSSNDNPNSNGANATSEDSTQPEGGISAGGGGTLPSNPIGTYRVVQILAEAKRQLRLYITDERKYDRTGLNQKFFFGEENLATQLEKTDIEILEDRPCKDRNGHDVDASIVASRPNTICFSAFRVAPKLVEEVANKEIVALLVHELSHFLGATEEEAVSLQRFAALRLQDVTSKDADALANFKYTMDVSEELSIHANFRKSALEAVQKKDISTAVKILHETYDRLNNYDKYFTNLPFSFIDYKINNYKFLLQAHLHLTALYLTSQDPNDKLAEEAKIEYHNCFGDKAEVTTAEIQQNCDRVWKDIFDQGYIFRKATSPEHAIRDLGAAQLFMYELSSQVRAIGFNQPLPKFTLPGELDKTHPWQKFVGYYNAEQIHCESTTQDSHNHLSGLKFIELKPGVVNYPLENINAIYVTENYGHMWGTDPFYNNAGNGLMTVSGDEKTATMTKEQGTRWYDRQNHGWSMTTKSISSTDKGLILTMKSEYFSYNFRGQSEGYSTCQYQLNPAK